MADGQNCIGIVELITEYIEGTMPAEDRERFEAHLRGCRGCIIYLAQMRETIALTGRLTEESIAPEARAALLMAFRDWKRAG